MKEVNEKSVRERILQIEHDMHDIDGGISIREEFELACLRNLLPTMTTNSPNPVDGDVQALIKDCQRDIEKLEKSLASNNDHPMSFSEKHLRSELARQQIALAALTAEPCAYLYGSSFERGEVEGEVDDSPGAGIPVYATPPAQLLRPVELPKEMDFTEVPAHYWDSDEAKAYASGFNTGVNESSTAIEIAGYEVKS